MISRSVHAVLRSLAAGDPPVRDGALLRQFIAGDDSAFSELVQRHGRLVWAVCRHLTHSDADADDAFQATFLVLLRNAKKIRDGNRLSAWLHGVAYKVCAKSRQSTARRTRRERAAAVSERNGSAVSPSAWDRALAAVHEEVGKLPETLRLPFVLCCLEGKGVTEAAQQLGWKLGTFSGRLTRAKDVLVAKLDARGLTLSALAGLGLASPPAASVAKTTAFARAELVIPSSILQLTQGVVGMSMTSFKMLAVAMLLTCGVGISAGTGWVAVAGAQPASKQPPGKPDPADEVKRLQAELEKALKAAEPKQKQNPDLAAQQTRDLLAGHAALEEWLVAGQKGKEETYTVKTTKWEYDFVEVSDLGQTRFVKFLQDRENRGWEFNGTTALKDGSRSVAIWIFRRPAKGATADLRNPNTPTDYFRRALELNSEPHAKPAYPRATKEQGDDAKAIEAEIARLREKLAHIKPMPAQDRVTYAKKDLPLDPPELTEILLKLAGKRFKDAHYTFTPSSTGLLMEGDKEVIDWAIATIKKLADK